MIHIIANGSIRRSSRDNAVKAIEDGLFQEVVFMDFSVGISVVMSSYNTELSMLKEAVESILNQTFRDFEFLIIDDGSTDGSDQYLKSLSDERVKIIQNPQNIGITKSLNIGFKAAKGKYIARMDADDISLPTRLEKQYEFMEAHPEVIVCGTRAGILDEKRNVRPLNVNVPDNMEEYRVRMIFLNPGPTHPTAFFRHEKLLEHHILYDEKLIYAQDYGMWEVVSRYGKVSSLDEVLLYRRKHEKQISIAKRDVQKKCDKMTQKKILSDLLGSVSDKEVELHYTHSTTYNQDATITPEVAAWYDRLLQANQSRHLYNQNILQKYIGAIKKRLVLQTIKQNRNLSKYENIRLVFRYLPFLRAVKTILFK